MKYLYITIILLLISSASSYVQGQGLDKKPIDHDKPSIEIEGTLQNPALPVITITATPAPPPPPANKKRMIFWIHGLGGDVSAWSKAHAATENGVTNSSGAVVFKAREADCRSIDYVAAENAAMEFAGDLVRDEIHDITKAIDLTKYHTTNLNYIIGHSQGGIVARAVQYVEHCTPSPVTQKRFGGIATFGAPNQGAQILNNLGNGYGDIMADYACWALTKAPLSNGSILNGISKIIGLDLQSSACNFIKPVFSQLIRSFQPNLTNDYKVGAPFLDNKLKTCTPAGNSRIAFYGVESREKIFWRTATWFVNEVNAEPTFEANEDLAFYNSTGKKIIWDYTSNLVAETAKSWSSGIVGGRISKKESEKIRNWSYGINWVTEIDQMWSILIGGLTPVVNSQTYCICTNEKTNQVNKTKINPNDACMSTNPLEICSKSSTTSKITYLKHESDGIVLAKSAQDFPGATFIPQKMINSSHIQMRNNEALRFHLKKLYDGKYDRFFETDKL